MLGLRAFSLKDVPFQTDSVEKSPSPSSPGRRKHCGGLADVLCISTKEGHRFGIDLAAI
jgi:hypothetical protein